MQKLILEVSDNNTVFKNLGTGVVAEVTKDGSWHIVTVYDSDAQDAEIIKEDEYALFDQAQASAMMEAMTQSFNKEQAQKILEDTCAVKMLRAYWFSKQVDEVLCLFIDCGIIYLLYTEVDNDELHLAYIMPLSIVYAGNSKEKGEFDLVRGAYNRIAPMQPVKANG